MKFMKYLTDDIESTPAPKQGYKLCFECKRERPLSDFIRKATLRQSRAWTKNPTSQKRLKYEGRKCNACHNAHRLQAIDLNPEAYRKRLVSAGLNPLKVEDKVNARRLRGKLNRTERTARTKLKNAEPQLKLILEKVADIEKKLVNKMIHLHRSEQDASVSAIFCARYRILFESVKQQLKIKAKAGQRLPEDWHELIADRFKVDLWKLFREIPAEHKQRFAPFMQHIPRTPDAD